MLNVIILVLILIGLTVHRYLTSFWEQNILPYPNGFLIFANIFIVIYLISFIWMFGIIAGIVVAALCFLQVVYSAGLWIFSLPWLIKMQKKAEIPKVNTLVYIAFSWIIMALTILTVLNFFVSPYKELWDLISWNIWPVIAVIVSIIIVGNFARMIIMPKLIKQ